MNIAVIIAGGSGHRMGQDIPKQFINVYDKPVLIYTLEGFQDHPQIDAIEVVCIDGWHDVLRAYAKQFQAVIPGRNPFVMASIILKERRLLMISLLFMMVYDHWLMLLY